MFFLDMLSLYILISVWQNLGFWWAVLVAIVFVGLLIIRRWEAYISTCRAVADLINMYRLQRRMRKVTGEKIELKKDRKKHLVIKKKTKNA